MVSYADSPRQHTPNPMVGLSDVLDVTLSLDTSAYADNDVLAAPQEVTNFFRKPGGVAILQSLELIDEDDQAIDVDVVFLNANGSIGNENAAFAPADSVARTIIGKVSLTSTDYMDCSNSQIAFKGLLGWPMKAAADTTSVWVAAVVRSGTPTFTASGIRLKIGVIWD